MIQIRSDLVLVKQVEDKASRIVLVGASDENRKYYDIVVVQVGADVTRCKEGDIVVVGASLQIIPLDPTGSGIKTPHAFVSEAAIHAVRV